MPVVQQNAQAIKSDTLTLLLCNALHRHENIATRAAKVRKTAKVIQKRTKDKQLKDACRKIRATKIDGLVIQATELAEFNYFREYE